MLEHMQNFVSKFINKSKDYALDVLYTKPYIKISISLSLNNDLNIYFFPEYMEIGIYDEKTYYFKLLFTDKYGAKGLSIENLVIRCLDLYKDCKNLQNKTTHRIAELWEKRYNINTLILKPGIYRVIFKNSSSVLAAVGKDENGDGWYAPVNYNSVPCKNWEDVEKVVLVLQGD